MRLLSSLREQRRLPREPWLNAMAAVAVGMFIGCWVIGPALTGKSDKSDETRQAAMKAGSLSYDAMLARPDPSPYRAATPAFDNIGQTHYADAARAKAQAEAGGRRYDDDPWSELREERGEDRSRSRWHYRYRAPDRHAVY